MDRPNKIKQGGYRLRTKALMLFLATTIVVVVEGLLAFGLYRQTQKDFQQFEELEEVERDLMVSLALIRDLLSDVNMPLKPGEENGVVGHWKADLDMLGDVSTEVRARVGPEALDLLDAQRSAIEEWLVGGISTAEADAAGGALGETLTAYNDLVLTHLHGVNREVEETLEIANARRNRLFLSMLFVGGVGLTGVSLVGWSFLSSLVAALHLLKYQTGRIARGEAVRPLPIYRSDEVAEVMASVNAMAEELSARGLELESMRTRFGQQERMFALGVFAAQMAHELGNPIQAIMALCLHVSDNLRGNQSRDTVLANLEYIDLIAQHAERLSGTIRDVRNFARPDRLERTIVDVNEIVHSSVRLMRFEPRLARCVLDVDCQPDVPAVYGVPDHIMQVLVNLLINAADAVDPHGGRIAITTVAEDDKVVLRVADNGHGMNEAVRAAAFAPFFTTKHNHNGTGLGLTICKTIVDEHSGEIAVVSAPERGTTVEVRLPQG